MTRAEAAVESGNDDVPAHWLAVEEQIRALPVEELGPFLKWFRVALADIDWELWDWEIEQDAAAGRLGKFEEMAAEALRQHAEGKTTPL